jgi:hypothetical protein
MDLGVGYSIATEDQYEGGFLLDTTVGVSFKVSNKSVMNVGIGYEMQGATVRYYRYSYYYTYLYTTSANLSSISLVIGLNF